MLATRTFVIILLLFFFLSGRRVEAQEIENPVKWSLTAKLPDKPLKPGDQFTAQITAQITEGWHLYSPEQAAGGPKPTRITLPEEQPFKSAGDLESPAPQTEFDENFGIETTFYEESAIFTLPVQVANNAPAGKQKLRIHAYYQTCNGQLCRPPKTVKLEVEVNVVSGKMD